MKLSQVQKHLEKLESITFQLPSGQLVEKHFHVTEVGKITKDFIDCGGTIRSEQVVNFQLWKADDYDHRLHPEKLNNIIELSKTKLAIPDAQVEVEYQGETIQKFGLDFDGTHFLLTTKQTDCLAKDSCGITKVSKSDPKNKSCCGPSSCC